MKPSLTVYKASAGSGKTFTLAVQYIKMLLAAESDRQAYSHILAVTFTNKATAEMKTRILQQLYGIWKGLSGSADYTDKLCEELENDGVHLTMDEIRRRAGLALSRILHDYSRFRIETIDSFFQSVMKNLAHELSLTANLRVELNNAEVLNMAVDRILERLHLTPVVLGWILEYVNDRITNNERWDIAREVKSFSEWIFNEHYLSKEQELREALKENRRIGELRQALNQELRGAVDAVQSFAVHFGEEMERYGITCDMFSRGNSLATYLKKLEDGNLSADFGSTLQKYTDNPENMLRKNDRDVPEMMEAARHFSSLLAELHDFQLREEKRCNSALLSLKYLNPLRLLGVVDEEVTAVNNENNSFLLARTPILLNELIENNDAPFIFEKMGTVFHHVMIDEFQDTSALQWKNFKLLLEENMSSGFGNLIVGDIKQSIYRWRNGDWRILKNIGSETGQQCDVRTLDVNFRSERRIVGFNNRLFKEAAQHIDRLVPDAAIKLSDVYSDVHQECPAKKGNSGYVRIRLFDTADRKADWEGMMLDDLCDQAERLHNEGVPYGRMAILVRKRKHAAPIIRCFARRLPDVKLVSDEAFLLSSSLSVNIIINAMRCLLRPDDRISAAFLALHAAGGSPAPADVNRLAEHPLEELLPADFIRRREELRCLPLYELQEELFRLFRLERIPHQEAYLFAYFDQVTNWLKDNPSDISSLLNYWDETLCKAAIPSGEIDGIRILTIHKSKGLQIHTVFVPYCDWDIEKDSTGFAQRGDLLWCSPSESPYNLLPVIPVHIEARMKDSVYRREYEEEHLQRRVDALNTLYVAFTRAEKNLFAWCRTQYALTERSGIGDAVSLSLPDFEEDVQQTKNEAGQVELYEYGQPVVSTASRQKKKEDNRMKIGYRPETVHMRSYDARIEFCQSNKARDFIESLAGKDTEVRTDDKRRLGLLMHKIFSTIYTRDDIPKALLRLETEGLIATQPERDELIRAVERAFALPEVARWFDGSMKLYNECPILSQEYNKEKSKYHSYRPDRVMFGTDTVIVVDFKFGARNDLYRKQVDGYMELLRLMEPDKEVKGYLWYILNNELEKVDV